MELTLSGRFLCSFSSLALADFSRKGLYDQGFTGMRAKCEFVLAKLWSS